MFQRRRTGSVVCPSCGRVAFDREHAWVEAGYLIVPVAGGNAGPARSWRLTGLDGELVEEAMVTVADRTSEREA